MPSLACRRINAVAKINLDNDSLEAILPLGYKDHSLQGNGMDASNRTDDIQIQPWPTLGMYQPDAMQAVNIAGINYIVTANEGDARDYDAFSEETRVEDITLDSVAYPDFAELQMEENLGRLRTTNARVMSMATVDLSRFTPTVPVRSRSGYRRQSGIRQPEQDRN